MLGSAVLLNHIPAPIVLFNQMSSTEGPQALFTWSKGPAPGAGIWQGCFAVLVSRPSRSQRSSSRRPCSCTFVLLHSMKALAVNPHASPPWVLAPPPV